MIGLGTMLKLAKGTLSPDELAEVFSSMGMEIEIQEIDSDWLERAFTIAASASMREGAKALAIHGSGRDGSRMEALIVLVPSQPGEETRKKLVDGKTALAVQ